MNCRHARRLIDAELTHPRAPLPDRDQAAVRAHLAACAGCAGFARALREGLPALRGLPTVPANPRALAALDRATLRWLQRAPFPPLRHWLRQGLAVAGVALLALLVAVLFPALGHFRPQQPATAAGTPSAVAAALPSPACPAASPAAAGSLDDELVRAIVQSAAAALRLTADQLGAALDSGQALADLAGSRGVTAEQVQASALAAGNAHLASAVQGGTMTQAQADKYAAILPMLVEKVLQRQPKQVAGTTDPAMRSPSAQEEAASQSLFDALMAAAAGPLGLTPEQVRAEFATGNTIGTLAQRRGVALQPVREAMRAAGQSYLAGATASGTLTADQAANLAAILPLMVEKLTTVPEAQPGKPADDADPCAKATVVANDVVPAEDLIAALTAGAAGALGLTPEALQQAQAAGKSLADLAQERHLEARQIAEAMLRTGKERLALAVQRGELTQQQADARAGILPDLVKKLLVAADAPPANKP